MEKLKVFISHSEADDGWARSFAHALKQLGVDVWYEEFELQPSASRRDALEAGLRNSDVLVALLDPENSSRANLFFELGAAIGMGKQVVPIVPKDMDKRTLPIGVRLGRYLVRDTPKQTAEELSTVLQVA